MDGCGNFTHKFYVYTIYMEFLGEHKCKLDERGRLRLPSSLKQQLNPAAQGKFVVNRGLDGCLELYPYDLWLVLRKKMFSKLNKFNKKHRDFMRMFLSGATELELDNVDRLNFPNQLLQHAGIEKECYLTPGQGTIEMWSVKRYEEQLNSFKSDDYQDIAQDVMGDIDLWNDNES